MSMLDKIREALKPFGVTYYGNATPANTDPWDYYVFRRSNLKKASNGVDFVRHYAVAIVKENYIPEGHEFEIIDAIRKATKMRLANVDITYSYVYKGQTDLVVEVALITFAEPLKGCGVNG